MVLIVLTLCTISCSKNDDGPTPTTTDAELLAHKWYFKKSEYSATTPPTVDIANTCQQNTYINFLTTGDVIAETFELNMGNCESSGGPQAGTYELTSDEDQIIIHTSSASGVWNIEVLTETELVLLLDPLNKYFFER